MNRFDITVLYPDKPTFLEPVINFPLYSIFHLD